MLNLGELRLLHDWFIVLICGHAWHLVLFQVYNLGLSEIFWPLKQSSSCPESVRPRQWSQHNELLWWTSLDIFVGSCLASSNAHKMSDMQHANEHTSRYIHLDCILSIPCKAVCWRKLAKWVKLWALIDSVCPCLHFKWLHWKSRLPTCALPVLTISFSTWQYLISNFYQIMPCFSWMNTMVEQCTGNQRKKGAWVFGKSQNVKTYGCIFFWIAPWLLHVWSAKKKPKSTCQSIHYLRRLGSICQYLKLLLDQ
jgi:hypothetical protein